ncbi:MAG: tetratricopeptide repeat protein [Planctomycetaceae bacterium]|nr:tetratricopeptide repeat protein [Planctomycetaceae bacterium]
MTDAVLRKFVVAGLLAGVTALNACTYWHGDLERIVDQSERDFRRDLVGPFNEVPLKTVISNPTAYKYTHVRFDAVLNRVGERGFIPFLTTFDPENFVGFSVWSNDAKLWQSDDRAHSYPLLFLRKDSPSIGDLFTAGRFSLVRISATVMSDYEMKPWLLVNRVEVLESSVYTEDALADLAMAKEALAAKKPAVAIRHYEDALKGIWTTSLRLEIHLTLARLYEGRGDLEAALTHYKGALTNDPANEEALQGVERNQRALESKSVPPPAPQQ